MLGNEAIACGLLENDCRIATSYPGTPASEILSSLMEQSARLSAAVYAHWSINEKVAFETAFAGCMTGLRTAVSMKQVGLNVASDPMMSAAYMGVKGGFVIISADDPGPHSSQTEQDSRLMAMMAKIPVLDPDSPQQAKELVSAAYRISEQYKTPVMIRPTTRVCHARQDVEPKPFHSAHRKPDFVKDPARWAATPKFRFRLHGELEERIGALADEPSTAPFKVNPGANGPKALIASGVAAAHAREILETLGLWDSIPLYQILQPYPLHHRFISELIDSFEEILVLEETMPVIEMQIADRHRVKGKMNGWMPKVGELLPEKIEERICAFAGLKHRSMETPPILEKRPTLCAGCPHRASFFAIKKAAPKAIYTSDIGCYTLGLNMGAVDTVLCMGAAIGQAIGFYHAYKGEDKRPDIIATIGDSTFFHAGIPALVDAVVQKVKFVLLILDNRTTAMTGNQPTPAAGRGTDHKSVDIAELVRGCGIEFCREADPYRLDELIALIREAVSYSRENGPAVVISRHPCVIDDRSSGSRPRPMKMEIGDGCDGCGYCIRHFECPALVSDEDAERVFIDEKLCIGCGLCRSICPKQAIQPKKDPSATKTRGHKESI
jgi:indolepyruvate ferredoxin oxidoreductase alpha subunit